MYQRISLLLLLIFFLSLSSSFAQSGFDTSESGKTKHCIYVPANCHQHSNEKCQYMISHAPSSDGKSVILEIYGKRKTAEMQYVAAGFSQDDIMGGEPVVACVANPNGNTLLSYSYNQGKSNRPNVGVDKSDAELLESVVTDAVIYCKIRQAATPTNDALPNLASDYQLLVARGPRQENGQLAYHSERQAIPLLTNFMAPLPLTATTAVPPTNRNEPAPSAPGLVVFPNQTNSIGNNNNTVSQPSKEGNPGRPAVAVGSGPLGLTSATKLTIVKWHGFLMLLAWFGMIAIGIFSARYLKPGTPNTKIGGTHLWFHLHRGLNFTAVMIIIVLTTLIFIPKTAASPSSYINNLNSADTPLKTAIMIFRDEINSFNSTTSMNSSEIINRILQFIELSFGWNAEVKFKLCQLSNDPVLSPFLNFIQCDFNITSTAVFNTAPGLVVFPNQTNSIRNNNNTVCQPLKEGIPDHPSPTKPSKSTFFGLTDVTIDKVLEMIDSCRHLVNSTRPWIKNLICES